jgi:hypothetical protein
MIVVGEFGTGTADKDGKTYCGRNFGRWSGEIEELEDC